MLVFVRRECRRYSVAVSLEEFDMSTQVVLITGALTGIGRAAAVAFCQKGCEGRRFRAS